MKKQILLCALLLGIVSGLRSEIIPIDTTHFKIQANAYVLETYKGQASIYLKAGAIIPKDIEFSNGVIEFDLYLKKEQCFPGVSFRYQDNGDAEEFYIRPHLPGKPDGNQVAGRTQGITPWQLYFGPKYSFPYEYNYDDWTHVKILVSDDKAQVFLDYSEKPNHSWYLFNTHKKGALVFNGGMRSGIHIANINISHDKPVLKDFNAIEREAIPGIVKTWEISDMFEESLLDNTTNLESIIDERKWQGSVEIEEGTAANISRIQQLYNGQAGNTVLAKITITSESDQLREMEFGYSDRVMVILNDQAIYKGTNKWRSRDYRYLGTVGLFDSVFLNLKKGKNTVLMALSEDFGGWLVTARIKDLDGLKIE